LLAASNADLPKSELYFLLPSYAIVKLITSYSVPKYPTYETFWGDKMHKYQLTGGGSRKISVGVPSLNKIMCHP
jgi:hypothetical protein